MPRKSQSATKGLQKANARIGQELLPFPIKGKCPADPPMIRDNPPKKYVIRLYPEPTSTVDNYISIDHVRSGLESHAGVANPCFVLQGVQLWGNTTHEGVYLMDVTSGVTFVDRNKFATQRPRVSIRYPKNIQPLISASHAGANLVKIGIEGYNSSTEPTTKAACIVHVHVIAWTY